MTTRVSRTLMIPLQPTEPAAVAPNQGMYAAAYGSLSAMPFPIDTASGLAQRSDTGDQVAGVQPDFGTLFHAAEHVLIGANVYASPTSSAVKATSGEVQLGDQLLFGFRTRVGFVGELPNGVGLITTFSWGFDFLPYADTLSGTTSQFAIGSTLTGVVTWQVGLARLYLGPSVSSQPTLTKMATVCAGCGTSVDYDLQISLSGGVKLQVAPTAALHFGLTMPLVRDRVAWTPVFTAGFSFDFTRPQRDQPAEESPPRPPPPPPPPLPPPAPPLL